MINTNDRLKMVKYMTDTSEYFEVDSFIEQLLPEIQDNIESYRKWKRLLREREELQQQIRDIVEVLRGTSLQ